MSNLTYKVCSSGLSKDESNKVKELISKKKNIEFLDEDISLPSKCTHLVTKTLPELKKTEKVLSALAKGIPIIDFKYVKKIVSSSNVDKWNEEEYDIGGKHFGKREDVNDWTLTSAPGYFDIMKINPFVNR